jgi:hypothetical protein
VRSSFDFDAGSPRQRQRALGIGEHELVVSFSSGRPVIESENSRVIRRGHGNMTWLLREGVDFAAPVDLAKPGTRIRLPEQRAARGSSALELKAPMNAVATCGDFLTAQARELGSNEVRVSGIGPEVRSPDGAVSVLINARIGYARQGKKQVRQAQVTCRIDPGGRVVALH